jgi:hypothetical protein
MWWQYGQNKAVLLSFLSDRGGSTDDRHPAGMVLVDHNL